MLQYVIKVCFMLQYAIKSIRKNKIETEQDLVRVRREIEIMATLSHPHITMVHEGMYCDVIVTSVDACS